MPKRRRYLHNSKRQEAGKGRKGALPAMVREVAIKKPFNAKIKAFRSQLRGVAEVIFPMGQWTGGRRGAGEGAAGYEKKRRERYLDHSRPSLKNGGYLLSHCHAVPSAWRGLTSLFGMGRGGSLAL